jgi:riboflavin synthase
MLRFDVVPETLARTTLGGLAAGSRVNLERAATAATLMGGHVVQGHVEGVGEVRAVRTEGEWRVTIKVPNELMPCITPKGSIAVEGVSLTVASVDVTASTLDVALIPTTLEVTTLGGLKPGSRVNLETDIMARTIVHYMRNFTGR